MITAEEAREMYEKETLNLIKRREEKYKNDIAKIESLIKSTCKLENHESGSERCCKVKFVDNKANLSPDELIYDKVVFSRILNELEVNGFTVYNHIEPTFRFNEFGSTLATGYIGISW